MLLLQEKHRKTGDWLGSRHFLFPEVARQSATLKLGMSSPTLLVQVFSGWSTIIWIQFSGWEIFHWQFHWLSLNTCHWNCWSRLYNDHVTAWPITFSGNRWILAPGHEKIQQVICKSLNIAPCHSMPFSSCSLWGGSWICWPFHHWQRRRYMNSVGSIHRQFYFKVNVM